MQMKTRERLLILLAISCFFNGIHYFLLEQLTAGCIFLLSTIRFIVNLKYQSKKLALIFLTISVLIAVFTFSGLLTILGLCATVLITLSGFYSDKTMRLLMIGGGMIWIIHNTILMSPVAIILEINFVLSGLLGYYRHYIAKRPCQTENSA